MKTLIILKSMKYLILPKDKFFDLHKSMLFFFQTQYEGFKFWQCISYSGRVNINEKLYPSTWQQKLKQVIKYNIQLITRCNILEFKMSKKRNMKKKSDIDFSTYRWLF